MIFFPFRHLFNINNRFSYLVLMGILMSLVSNDITTNSVHFFFNALLIASGGEEA